MIIIVKKPLTGEKLKKAFAKFKSNKIKGKGFDAKKYAGKLKGVFGDGLQYQKTVRDEWD